MFICGIFVGISLTSFLMVVVMKSVGEMVTLNDQSIVSRFILPYSISVFLLITSPIASMLMYDSAKRAINNTEENQ